MDAQHPAGVFVLIGIFQALVMLTAVGGGRQQPPRHRRADHRIGV
jgi:hypothetical protein